MTVLFAIAITLITLFVIIRTPRYEQGHKVTILIFVSLFSIIGAGLTITKQLTQGMPSVLYSPLRAAEASKKAPDNPWTMEKFKTLDADEHDRYAVVLYKFGCKKCQALWAMRHDIPELADDRTIWIPSTQNFTDSVLEAHAGAYPTIITFDQIGLVKNSISQPTDASEIRALLNQRQKY